MSGIILLPSYTTVDGKERYIGTADIERDRRLLR
jgi:hypothetical protein